MVGAVPKAPWAGAIRSKRHADRRLPQTIAHRGYKAKYPENSMAAFRGAADVGAHAIETDVHLSSDGVVVLSHDASLKRCFGVDQKIAACDWAYLSTLQTTREPRQRLPRLRDLLEWLAEPGNEEIWVLLDIKIDDEADALVGAIAATLSDVSAVSPWHERIVLGCWNATFIKASRRILPAHPVVLITWFLPYARHFLRLPSLGYNVFQRALVGPLGAHFLRRARADDRLVFAWTVNEECWMEWCLRRNVGAASDQQRQQQQQQQQGEKLIDGVITDDPKLFLDVCARWEDEQDGKVVRAARSSGVVGGLRGGLKVVMQLLVFQVIAPLFYFHRRFVAGKLDLLTGDDSIERVVDEAKVKAS